MLPTKFQFIWSSGFRGEDSIVTMDDELQVMTKACMAFGQVS
jgi:hypothetical protein